MNTAESYAEFLLEVEAKVKDLQSLLCRDFGYKLETVLTTHAQLFHRFCPYKIGDRVQLTRSFEKQHGHGWNASAHFLIEGAIATVINCDFRDGLFVFGLSFDDESWIDAQGVTRPTSNHTFSFSENFIREAS